MIISEKTISKGRVEEREEEGIPSFRLMFLQHRDLSLTVMVDTHTYTQKLNITQLLHFTVHIYLRESK